MADLDRFPHDHLTLEELGSIRLPEGQRYTEALEMLFYIAKVHSDEVSISLNDPATADQINGFMERTGIRLTEELKSLYAFANGIYIHRAVDLYIYPLEQAEKLYCEGSYDWWIFDEFAELGTEGGCGDQVLMERSTGRLFIHDHEDPEMYIGTEDLKDIFENSIDMASDMLFIEDQRIKDYIKKMYDEWKAQLSPES
ncbi:MAG: SMI1/KNR4 family protein [Ruminococcus sp.]|nr:SMI1/KNR4 family protein [Ruminococcus sp.]